MPEWAVIVLAVIAVPLAAILGGLAIAAFAIYVRHRARMAQLEIEEKERQAEADRQLLGLGGKDTEAHLSVILDRLSAVEKRLDQVEAIQAIQSAKARTGLPTGDTAVPVVDRRETHEERA